mgnify:CR=1 FL=1
MTSYLPSDADAALFGNRFATAEVPSTSFPDVGMSPTDAMRLVAEDLALEGPEAELVERRGEHRVRVAGRGVAGDGAGAAGRRCAPARSRRVPASVGCCR